MEKKLAFLLYDNRSGSTLLSALLNRYKGISVSQESKFISRIIEYEGKILTESLERIFYELSNEIQFRELNFNPDDFIENLKAAKYGAVSKKELIESILNKYFEKRDSEAQLRVVKQGDYLYIREILDMFPESVFIQIVRDGRAVYNSKKRTISFSGVMQETNPLNAARNWVQKLKKAELYNQKVITLRYEDLVQDPDSALHFLLDRLNVPSGLRTITKKQEAYYYDLGSRQKSLHQNIKNEPQLNFVDKWKDQLSKKEIIVYNYWAQDYLKKYNYETSGSSLVWVSFYTFQYLIILIFKKAAIAVKFITKPSLMRLRVKRLIRMISKK